MGKLLEKKIRKALYEFSLIEDDSPIAVALSGGKDSLTLLHFLCAISGRGFPPFPVEAIHINGEYSCGANIDLSYLKNICERLQVPLTICKQEMPKEDFDCYSCSRMRRKLLFDTAKKRNIQKIAFGHHRDDCNQTLLLNLLQKAEFEAMLPKLYMYRYAVTIIRPLILVEENQIIAYAKDKGFFRYTCQCPKGKTSKREEVKKHLHLLQDDFSHSDKNLFAAALKYGSKKAERRKIS